jgi:hypothetical protein
MSHVTRHLKAMPHDYKKPTDPNGQLFLVQHMRLYDRQQCGSTTLMYYLHKAQCWIMRNVC